MQPESTEPGFGAPAAKLCQLGLPMWSNRGWAGSLFPKSMGSGEALHHYSQVFDSVEGNTTFYALPSAASVSSWLEQVSGNFQFSFKLPRTVTHDNQLRYCGVQLSEYFNRLEPLAARCGTFMIQLPESFEPRQLDDLANFLSALPADYHFAVEVRHSDFFSRGTEEQALNELLRNRGVDRVCFDSRALFSQGAITDEEIAAQKKKPKLPVHAIATSSKPVLRFIGCSDVEHNKTYFAPWVKKITQWRRSGIVPTVFIHTPDNRAAPEQAVILHQMLSAVPGWQPLAKPLLNSGDATQMSFF